MLLLYLCTVHKKLPNSKLFSFLYICKGHLIIKVFIQMCQIFTALSFTLRTNFVRSIWFYETKISKITLYFFSADEGGLCSQFAAKSGSVVEDLGEDDLDLETSDQPVFQSRNTGLVLLFTVYIFADSVEIYDYISKLRSFCSQTLLYIWK